uniref:Metallothionein-like protein n=1 Tax=Atropa belladonna TaxID=33113 RepID=Q94I98_ATRBE|nr:methallothioneine-like protein [Atropa belladonna]
MSCCGGNCGCESRASKCGTGCGGCKMYPDMSYSESTTSETLVLGVGPEKTSFRAMEFGESPVAENGCKCGSDCKCDPCTCSK